MSYLGVPRLNIAGSFYTDPSTVDNDPAHYDESCVNPSPWQDPTGSHYFSLQDILAGQAPNRAYTAPKVMGAVDKNGNATAEDPIVGTVVASVDAPGGIAGGPFSPAKMIDLDVYQQAVSSIHGFFLQIPVPGTTDSIVAAMDPCVLNSCRFDRVLPTRGWQPWDSYGAGSYGGDTNASGVFQSILRVNPANWPEQTNSTILNELRAACMYDLQGNLVLSIRMTLDGYKTSRITQRTSAWGASRRRLDRLCRATPASAFRAAGWLAALTSGVHSRPSRTPIPGTSRRSTVRPSF